jgi:PhnB protein
MAVKPIPDGFHSVTPFLVVEGASRLIDFAKQAFGAQERFRMDGPNGTVMHAEIQIGDSVIMLGESMGPDNPPLQSMLYVYLPNVDEIHEQALAAGATSVREPADQFWGDRSGAVKDAFGNQWWIATHIEDVPPEEMEKRAAAAMAQAAG